MAEPNQKAGILVSPYCSPNRLDALDCVPVVMKPEYVMEPCTPDRSLCAVGIKYVRMNRLIERRRDADVMAGECADRTKMLQKSHALQSLLSLCFGHG
jgi:hypothetical protein